MHGPRAVRLDAAFGTPHGGGGLGDIEFFPVTQEKGLALTAGQQRHLGLDHLQDLSPGNRLRGALGLERAAESLERLEDIEVAVAARAEMPM